MGRKSIDQQLTEAEVAINKAREHEEIMQRLAEYMYDMDRLNNGANLLLKAQTLHQTRQAEYGEQYTASDAFQAALSQAEAAYTAHVKLARIALKWAYAAQQKLGLDGPRKKSFSGWLEQTQLFYDTALASPEILTALARLGLTQAKLAAGQKLVQQTKAANNIYEREKDEALDATIARDEALDVLDDWMDDFKEIAGVALADHPHWLESLGFGPM